MDALRPWLALRRVPGIGNLLYRRLMDRFGSPAAVFRADDDDLIQVQGVSRRLITAIRRRPPDGAVDGELDALQQHGFTLIPLTDPRYPPLLREIPDPPPVLYVHGTLPISGLAVAVVGSRHATTYGVATTRRLCVDLAAQGATIVSGMARGVDAAAHRGAIEGGGQTVAVMGTGLDRVYPRENERLYHQIAASGAVVSELPLGSGPDAHHFPARNRIISGLCHGTVVVEATGRSGSLITARLAAEQNREVFAVPGNVHSFKSVGTHALIKQGAQLVEHAGDILDELRPVVTGPPPTTGLRSTPLPPLTDEEAVVIDTLEAEPLHIDDVARRLSLPPGKIAGLLLQLELKALVVQTAGKRFCLAPGAGPGQSQRSKPNREVTSE